jgi:hypothetical protein
MAVRAAPAIRPHAPQPLAATFKNGFYRKRAEHFALPCSLLKTRFRQSTDVNQVLELRHAKQ